MPATKPSRRAPAKSHAMAAPPPESPLGQPLERKHVTVLFADLCGSTRRATGLDPEEARSDLEPALRLMCETVIEVGGIVSQVEGDGVQALFGAPLAQEDHALRACMAATALHQRARALAEEGGGQYTMRVGIDSGEIAIGSVREYRTRRFRADGVLLNCVRRLQESARPGSTLIGAATLHLAQSHVKVLDRRDIDAAGFDTPLEAYELAQTAVAPLASRRQLAPLIGRDDKLAALLEPARRVRAGQMQFVGVRGEAGIGKSRLALALSERLQATGFRCVWLQAHALGNRLPFDIVSELALLLLGVPSGVEGRAEAARTAMRLEGAALEPQADTLSELLNPGDPGRDWLALSPALRRRRLAELVLALLQRRVAEAPLLLVIDDLMHADRESLRLLEGVLRRLERAPLLVCGTYRPETTPRWADESWFIEHPLGPLEELPMQRLAAAILGSDDSVRDLSATLAERAGGNPFFLEQLAMELVDQGQLEGDPGAYRCMHPLPPAKPPPSINALVMSRVDRLPPLTKQLLECAAVLDRPFVPPLLAAMAQRAAPDAESGLRQAAAAGLLMAVPQDEAAFGFRHALLREIVLASLARPRRRELHRAAYEALRARHRADASEDPSQLAHHAYAGESWDEAAEWALRAMSLAIARSAHRDALNYFAVGLDAVGRSGNGDSQRIRRIELSLRMTALGALSPLGKVDEAVDNLSRAHAITRELSDHRRESGVALQLAFLLWVQGHYERGLVAAAAAQVSAQRSAGRSAQMAALQARMMLRHGQGRYRDVLAEAARVEREFAAELAELTLLPRWATIPSINLHVFSADSLAHLGDRQAAQAHCDRAYAELTRNDHAYSHILLDWVQGSLWLEQGRHGEAAKLFEDALRRCREQDVPTMAPPLITRHAVALAQLGRVAAAQDLIERAIADRLEALGGRYNAYYFPSAHAQVLSAAGLHDRALASAREALRATQLHGQRGYEAEAALLVAQVAQRGGQADAAAEHFAHALSVAAECGMALVEAEAVRAMERPAAAPG